MLSPINTIDVSNPTIEILNAQNESKIAPTSPTAKIDNPKSDIGMKKTSMREKSDGKDKLKPLSASSTSKKKLLDDLPCSLSCIANLMYSTRPSCLAMYTRKNGVSS
jgi:hypothetical protein